MKLPRVLAAAVVSVLFAARPFAQTGPTLAHYLSAPWSSELVAARAVDRIAWISYERGQRSVYTAAAPEFRAVRLTHFLEDDGVDLTSLSLSDDGSIATFVRGHTPNRNGWIANPTSNPAGAERVAWAVRTTGGPAWRVSETTRPALSPDGRWIAFAKDGQIYIVAVAASRQAPASARELKPPISVWGVNRDPVWSPDSSKLAFVSDRADHSFIAVYDLEARKVTYMDPGVDRDSDPAWAPDGRRLAFVRRAGLPFAQQLSGGESGSARGAGAAVLPLGLALQQAAQAKGPVDGLKRSSLRGGYSLALVVADVATAKGREFWHTQPGRTDFTDLSAIRWAGAGHVIFKSEPEEWIRYYSVAVEGGAETPVLLTPGEGAVEDTALSRDGKTLFYSTNAGDPDRRHIFKVATTGGEAAAVTAGDGIETSPVALASGDRVALISAGFNRPEAVAIATESGGSPTLVSPRPPADFPGAAHVVPMNVLTSAPDGLRLHNQLFLPADIKAGERRPAVVYVHGGPLRQALLGYNDSLFAYAMNQWLVSRGYVVLSINYRSGIGYGKSFRTAPNTSGQGNAEYQDVLAGARYLQSRADVDPERIGIWGRSYGGLLTAQALARNSDVFKVGVEIAGVVLRGSSLDPESVSYRSSAISEIANWKSPVLLSHGDDDRNVPFSQTTGLVQLLRAHNVYYELIVHPDDVHQSLLHRRWVQDLERAGEFLDRFLNGARSGKASDQDFDHALTLPGASFSARALQVLQQLRFGREHQNRLRVNGLLQGFE